MFLLSLGSFCVQPGVPQCGLDPTETCCETCTPSESCPGGREAPWGGCHSAPASVPQDCATSSSPLERALWGINQEGRKAVFKVIAVCCGSAKLASWYTPERFPGSGVACDGVLWLWLEAVWCGLC